MSEVRVLLVSPDPVAPSMAGPAIRYAELARVLAGDHDVTLAAPAGSAPVEGFPPPVPFEPRVGALTSLLEHADVLVAPPLAPHLLLRSPRCPWIVDLYNAEPFEGLDVHRSARRAERRALDVLRIDRTSFAVRRGTSFLCAGEQQRSMWLGFLAACRRIDSHAYSLDPTLESLLTVVPSGVAAEPPAPGAALLRGPVFPHEARIMVWNGGIWNWLDPLTVLRALALLRREDARWTLAFAGVGRPGRSPMEAAGEAVALARELGLEAAGAVHFGGWTPFAERGRALLEADVGVSAHRASLEARFAVRTRMLDLLWARVPILATQGDDWSEPIAAEQLGETVPPEDAEALAAAARRIADAGRGAYEPHLARAAAARSWDTVAAPLVEAVGRAAGSKGRRLRPIAVGLLVRHGLASAIAARRSR